ncbi:putative homeobox protein Nkx-2.2a-like [Scophthalmus maximus]|uniref:Putative homeobox protein Nkx-2.2a-like n=1 Tax=Scophthalmus maximus TaxID=52904 RepID=A0A2U9CUZ1_SCOMX|nr:putative homeobox protein Nkx-2.2a-like [Scophthalmus maximus]
MSLGTSARTGFSVRDILDLSGRSGTEEDDTEDLEQPPRLRSGLGLPLCAYSPLLHPAYGPEHPGLPQQHPGLQQLAHMYHWSW